MYTLRFKLIAPFMVGAALLTMVLAWYTYTSAKQEVEEAILSISAAKTNSVINTVNLLYKSMNMALHNMVSDSHAVELFAENPPSGATLASTEDWIDIVVRSNDYYRDMYIVDKNGVCLVASNPGFVGEDRSHLPYVRKALQGQFIAAEPSIGRVTKKFSLIMAGPLDVKEDVAGAMVMVNDLPNVVGYGQKTSYDSQTVFLAMLTQDGVFAAHKDNSLIGNKQDTYPELYEKLSAVGEHGGPVTYTLNGATYVGYAKVEPNTKWVVVASGRQDEVFASAYRMGLVVILISLAFLCLISFVVVRVASGVLDAMFSLISYAKAVSEGDLDRQLEATQRTDELGILHTALQRVVVALRHIVEETQKASEMKGRFLTNMSHEIRTPLNAIMGMTHLMLREQALTGKLREFAEKIRISSHLLFGLINDILDLSKVEAGMIELEKISFDLQEVIENALIVHQENARSKGLFLHMEYARDMSRHFVGDPLRIGQVLNNLLGNAIKFTNEGGVSVSCFHDAQTSSQDGVTVWIWVADTGMGIDEHLHEKLFAPFTQADASITRQFGGTGLGLTISRSLVELMGGSIEIDSTPQVGTTLRFSMRLRPTAEMKGEEKHANCSEDVHSDIRLAGKRLLVVEDNLINQTIMEELLRPYGAEIVLANNGMEAVEAIKSRGFDLVFMDVQMPVLDGLEATRRIRNMHGTAMPIIALTANAMKEDRARCLAAGMNAYLTKPVAPSAVAGILYDWLCERIETQG